MGGPYAFRKELKRSPMHPIRMLDLQAEFKCFSSEVRSVIDAVLQSQWFIGGPEVAGLEQALAERFDAEHVLAVSSGTDALLVALMALEIGPGDEVIVPTFTFFATAGAVWRVGAKPVFVDIDQHTFNLDPALVEAAITDRTRAVIAVHLFGQCGDMDAICTLAEGRAIAVIEDAAQAIGATFGEKAAGTLGDIACFSFYPTKNLGGFGEGGAVFTRNEKLFETMKQLRNHGGLKTYVHELVGGNFRLDSMKAGILGVKLKHLDMFNQRRKANAVAYDALLAGLPVATPTVIDGRQHVYHQYSILCDRRDELIHYLKGRGVDSGVYYPIPLHRQPCFDSLGYTAGSFPVAEQTCERIVSLPCHPMLNASDIEYVASCIGSFFETDAKATSLSSRGDRAAPSDVAAR